MTFSVSRGDPTGDRAGEQLGLLTVANPVFEPYGYAYFSPCGKYRYALGRVWDVRHLPRDLWILLNPSKAGERYDDNDQTARKVIGFSQRNGAAMAAIVNPNALIATDPRELRAARARGEDVEGPLNAWHIAAELGVATRVIVGWGGNVDSADRARMLRLLGDRELWCLGTTAGGEPRHPLMLAYATPLVRFEPSAGSDRGGER